MGHTILVGVGAHSFPVAWPVCLCVWQCEDSSLFRRCRDVKLTCSPTASSLLTRPSVAWDLTRAGGPSDWTMLRKMDNKGWEFWFPEYSRTISGFFSVCNQFQQIFWLLQILVKLSWNLKKKKKIWNRVDCQRSENRSETHKRFKERFLIGRNLKKRANFPGNLLLKRTPS